MHRFSFVHEVCIVIHRMARKVMRLCTLLVSN